jgi:tripartite-type tricarboxylate transporter receptor subunit TctC
MRRTLIGLITFLSMAVLALAATPCHAASYPERLIRLVVPFPAGGPTDVAARLIAQAMSSRLGQPVVVENLVGAGGRIGAKVVAGAVPDGYTLLLGGTNVNAIIGALYRDIGFDPIASFAPVAAVCTDTMALAISPNLAPQTFDQFVQYVRDRPGKLTYGATSGIYTQFAADYFKVKTGTDILFVPYKGGAPAITDLIGGHIDMVFNNKSTLLTHFKAGKLRPLAVTSKARWPELPDIPTMQELGVTGFPTEVWFGVLAPAGTPPAIVDALNTAINQGLASKEVQASLGELGLEAKVGTPQDLATALGEQAREWKTVIDTIGFKAE